MTLIVIVNISANKTEGYKKNMRTKYTLLNSGLFPEVLPPCFVSKDSKRAFHGIVGKLDTQKFHTRTTEYTRYSGTKHDGSRRFFGTPNIVNYFHISSFIWKKWNKFEGIFSLSDYSIGTPRLIDNDNDRAVKVPSLSELSKFTSKNLRYAPFILKADIAQCFPSLYTHSIPWAFHGIDKSKIDTDPKSKENFFNALDFFVRNGQKGNTRGVLIGPDAYRLIAEFVLSKIDTELKSAAGSSIVGAARHVDDYYIGLKTEHDAHSVLSHLREILANYELNLNDHKTKILSSLEPINDLWAQRLKDHTGKLSNIFSLDENIIERAICEAVATSQEAKSDSPLKILFRSFDEAKLYNDDTKWEYVEQSILRIIQKHPHCLDYACLLAAKRNTITDGGIKKDDWKKVAEIIIKRSLALNHHHEIVWMLWLLIVTNINIEDALIHEIAKSNNAHILSMLVQANIDGKIARKPKITFQKSLQSTKDDWLLNLVARSQGYTRASFSGAYSHEFEHLAKREIKLLDFADHIDSISSSQERAISRTRYGYDDDFDDDDYLDSETTHMDEMAGLIRD